jgi:hypothetical protein
MTLHEAIVSLLKQKNKPMSILEITEELNQSGLYERSDGKEVCSFQVHGRTHNFNQLFVRNGNMVSLKQPKTEK